MEKKGAMTSSSKCIQKLQQAYGHLCAEDLVTAEMILLALKVDLVQAEADWMNGLHSGLPPELIMYPWYLGILRRKQGKAKEAVQYMQVALERQKDSESPLDQKIPLNMCRLLLDYGTALCGLGWKEDHIKNLELAQSAWAHAADVAEQAATAANPTEQADLWEIAAKAAKCRAILLSVSDTPYLSASEIERAKKLFERARNFEGFNRVVAFENAPPELKRAIALELAHSSEAKENPTSYPQITQRNTGGFFGWLKRKKQPAGSPTPKLTKVGNVGMLEIPIKRKFDGPIQAVGRPPIKDREQFNALMAQCQKSLISREFEVALRAADELVEREPLRGVPWLLRTHALGGLGRIEEALTCCERAIEIDPSDPEKWELKGSILETLGRTAESLQVRQRAKDLR